MKILVNGAKGFIGRNLVIGLKNQGYDKVYEYDVDTKDTLLNQWCENCDFVFHLAGVNRPQNESAYMEGNKGFSEKLISFLKKNNNLCPVVVSSSIKAEQDNPYGISKRAEEEVFLRYKKGNKAKVMIYRLPNVFGKWCRPNYNSVIATFCHNISRGLDITVNDPEVELTLVYIDDVVKEFIDALKERENKKGPFCEIPIEYKAKLGSIAEMINSFKESRKNRFIPMMNEGFEKKLYSTYLSYLPEDEFKYNLKMNIDERGSFTEFIKTDDRGQVSVNVSKPGIIKGNHWHQTKNEKFLVVSGKGVVRFRKIDSEKIIEYYVSGDKYEVIDIPPGYTHNIENLGDDDLITVMWANEPFDPKNPDTYYLEV